MDRVDLRPERVGVVIIGIDTSSSLTSIAAIDEAGDVVLSAEHEDARRHAEVIGPMLADLVAAVDRSAVQAIACGVGPGPYTGLRVGIASAIAIGAAWDVPVHGLCSLDALAAQVLSEQPGSGAQVASDARRQELYWAEYDSSGERVAGPRVRPVADVDEGIVRGAASGVWVARRVLALMRAGASVAHVDVPLDVHGGDTGATEAALRGTFLLPPRPLYLRRPDAMVPRHLRAPS
jgi:tRNA threonylcarbamoyl adenosine modification protein YeaZ